MRTLLRVSYTCLRQVQNNVHLDQGILVSRTLLTVQHRCDIGIVGRFFAFRIFGWQQFGFGTDHSKDDINECCYPGKRTRSDGTKLGSEQSISKMTSGNATTRASA
jgi:hypothetical protein